MATNRGIVAVGTDHAPLLVRIRNRMTTTTQQTHRCRRVAWGKVDWSEVTPAIHARFLESEKLPKTAAAKVQYGKWHEAITTTLNSLPQGRRRFAHAPKLPPLQQEKLNKLNTLDLTNPLTTTLTRELREELVAHLAALEDKKLSALNGKRDAGWGKRLWEAVRPSANKVGESILLRGDGTPVPPRQASNAFARCFAAKHKDLGPTPPRQWTPSIPKEDWSPSTWTITPGEVKSAIRGLRSGQAADAAGTKVALLANLPSRALRAASKMLSSFLRDTFVPREWKIADVIPIPKEGKDIHKEEGHRPVSLLLLEAKVMEAILKSRIGLHVRSCEELDLAARQCGFRTGLGGQEALIHLVSCVKENAGLHSNWSAKGGAGSPTFFTMVAALDLSDAFCRANRQVIALALQRKKIPDCLIAWILEYLTDRQIRVFHDSTHSRLQKCEVGFPQGGLLGPLVWNIVIDVLIHELEEHIRLSNATICPQDNQGTLGCSRAASAYIADLRRVRHNLRSQQGWNLTPPKFKTQAAPSNEGVVYADDVNVWSSTYSPLETAAQITLMMNIIGRWAKGTGIKISPKTKIRWVIHTTNPSQLLPEREIEIPVGDLVIKVPPVRCPGGSGTSPDPIKMLGLWLDCRATFADHVKMVGTKIQRTLNNLAPKIALLRPPTRKVVIDALCLPHITGWLPIIYTSLSTTQKDLLETELNRLSRLTVQAIASSNGKACRLEAGHHDLAFLAEREQLRVSCRIWTLPPHLQTLLYRNTATTGLNRVATPNSVAAAQSPRKALIPPPSGAIQKRWLPSLGTIPPLKLGEALSKTNFAIDPSGIRKDDREAAARFNKEQIENRRTPWELWTDGSFKVTKESTLSGGAWCLWHEDLLAHSGCISLGDVACSYSAEAEALRAGIFATVKLLASLPSPPQRVRVFSDSLSCLSELARGPYRQSEQWAEAIWGALSLSSTSFSFNFVFAHTKNNDDIEPSEPTPGPESRADTVDKRAKDSLSSTATSPQWARDLARPILRVALEAAKARDGQGPSPMAYAGIEVTPSDPTTPQVPIQDMATLYRLRTGACPEIGGFKFQEADPCRLCGVLRGRYSSDLTPAIPHIFSCTGLPPSSTTLADLWDSPRDALKRYKEYLAAITTPPSQEQRDGSVAI